MRRRGSRVRRREGGAGERGGQLMAGQGVAGTEQLMRSGGGGLWVAQAGLIEFWAVCLGDGPWLASLLREGRRR